ncbi:hypothetical protein GCM10007147_20420 [Nocardiopsis kunsanensis]|uniref:Uncharacterized protein n=1 Tax=Nocardiopsis kunsanensis TaxID=141693 RepID=A0A918XCE6_9ACTN|nr:hypothetical protein GCM10007147_20420 [Nocardiopsis kunsanensis]
MAGSEADQLSGCILDDPELIGGVTSETFEAVPHLHGRRGVRQICKERHELACICGMSAPDRQLG